MADNKIKLIVCEVMKDEINSVLNSCDADIEFVHMGYHLYPQKLKRELQAIIDHSHGYTRIVLAFGLCGGAAHGLKSNESILTIPRVHDCVSVFLCRNNHPVCEFEKEMGVFYLTTGWLITEKNILSDYSRLSEKFGESKAKSLFSRMYDSYRKVLFIKTGCTGEEKSIEESKQIAGLLNAEFEITENRSEFFSKIVSGPWDDQDFINAAPGESICEDDFIISVDECGHCEHGGL